MKIANGELLWTQTSGYEKGYIVNNEEAAVVRHIFERYSHGIHTTAIAKELNKKNIPASKRIWQLSKVLAILRNEKYIETLRVHKYCVAHPCEGRRRTRHNESKVFPHHHEAIISEEFFRFVERIFAMKRNEQYPFGDFLKCPHCGKPLRRSMSRDN